MEALRTRNGEIDAADLEHVGSLVTGALLLVTGWRHQGPLSWLYKGAGVALLYRGQQGYRRLYDFLGVPLPAQPTGVGRFNLRIEAEVEVAANRHEVYRMWRKLSNLPLFMQHLVSVEELDDRRSEWTARAPLGTVVRWQAEIINDIAGERIAWQSLEGSGVDNAGTVIFENAGEDRTKLRVVLRYDPPADQLGALVAKAFGPNPQAQIEEDLRRFAGIVAMR